MSTSFVTFSAAAIAAVTISLPQPVAAAAPAARCMIPDQPARLISAPPYETPSLAAQQNLTGTAVVRVDLSATGSPDAVYLERSTGFWLLDRAALHEAKQMSFQPQTHRCAGIAGSYAVEVRFE